MVRHHARVIWLLMFPFALCAVPGAWAGAPSDQLREGVDRVFKILKDPELKGESKATQRRTAIVKAAHEIFDFGEMAKQSLGRHWDQRTPAERGEFVRLFTELIQRSYMSRVDQHGSQKMVVRSETVDGTHATVRTTLSLDQGSEMPLDYRMRNSDGRWQVYDISIDGISLIANYRAQFNKVIRTTSYEDLVARLKAKADFSAASAAPSPAGGKAAR